MNCSRIGLARRLSVGSLLRSDLTGDPPWFDKVDRNQDGVLDAGEINVLRDAIAKQAGDK